MIPRVNFVRQTLREMPGTLRLAAPIAAGHVGQMLMGVVDAVMVGHVGTLALAACSFGNSIVIVPAVTGFGVLTALTIRVSHAHGAGGGGIAKALHAGLGLSALGGVAAALLIHVAYPWTHHLGQAPGVVEEARGYLLVSGWSLLPAFVGAVARNYLEAQSKPWPAFWITSAAVLLNVALNYVFIYGNCGAPAMGLTGAGFATLLSRVAAAAALLWFVFAGPLKPSEAFKPDLAWLREQAAILRLGIPAGLQLLSEVGAFAGAALLIGRLGATPLAAHQIAMTCASMSFMVPLGISMASTVRIAQAVGNGKLHTLRPIAAGAWAFALVAMGVTAAIFLLAGNPLAALFVHDPAVVLLAAHLLVIAGLFQIFDGVQVVGSGLLRGLHDTSGPMAVTLTAYWAIALPFGSWLAFSRGLGAVGMWEGLACGLAIAALLLVRRFWTRTV